MGYQTRRQEVCQAPKSSLLMRPHMGYQTRRQEVCQAPKSSLLMRPPHGLSDQTTRSLSGTQELSSHEAPHGLSDQTTRSNKQDLSRQIIDSELCGWSNPHQRDRGTLSIVEMSLAFGSITGTIF
ncbi:hypothetical protein RRG08_032957 [Elysia crispata]|uniref:Uncharacterized protein n=1 Tax=Elysia crispata TaxID=231223 RepID=A0AAE0YRP0_9GAST|nr:hypothetical protein RRG08_032957 [Elysia crispata]